MATKLKYSLGAAVRSMAPAFAAAALCVPCAAQTPAGMPEAWTYESAYYPADPDESQWWSRLGDPLLDSLVNRGRANNYDVISALKRIDAARAQVGMVQSGYFPTIGISAGWNKERMSGMTTSPGRGATTTDFFNIGANMSWEIDVFGKIRAGVNQRKASWRASRAEFDGVMLSISAEIASTYISYRVARAQLQVAREHSESQSKIVKIAEARHETGLSSGLDVAQAKTVYYSTLATIQPLESQVHTLANSLATLLGEYASQLPPSLFADAELPQCPPMPAAGVPADLLRQRPDIMAAEQNLAAAAAAVGVAKKDFLPTLSIQGSIGTQSHSAKNLFKSESFAYTIAPTLSWTLFSGLERKYAVAAAKADMEAMIASYQSTVQSAVAEVDNAIYSYSRAIENIATLTQAMEQSREAYNRSVELYKSGNSGFINVADAQVSYLTYSNQLISARGQAVNAYITLCKALGGDTRN